MLAVPYFGTYSWLKWQRRQVKRAVKWQMIAGIDKEKLVHLSFTSAEASSQLHWKHSREFEFKGEMYDIAGKAQVGDTLHYWCWWDHEETKLNRQLIQLVETFFGKSPVTKERHQRMENFYRALFCSGLPVFTLLLQDGCAFHYGLYVENWLSPYIIIPSPPPKLTGITANPTMPGKFIFT